MIWRVSLPPSSAPSLIAALSRQLDLTHVFDWGGGLVWLAVASGDGRGGDDGGAVAIRGALAGFGGHAMLIRGGAALRSAVPVFDPQAGALAALSARLKESFDPRRILNPGRMYRDL